jgi:hypothetical protein
VLNAKGGEIKGKANGSANHLWISKKCRVRIFVFNQNPLIAKNCSLMGENLDYGKIGELVTFDQIYSWISWFTKTSVFDMEIGKEFVLWK